MSDETNPPPTPPSGEPPGANANANPAQAFGYVPRRGRNPLGGAIFGIWIVLIGVAFLLQNLGYFYVGQIWDFWPLILIGLGISRLVTCRQPGGRIWGLVMAGIGGVFLLSNLGYVTPHIWKYIWPFAIIVWGVMMLVGAPWKGGQGPGARFQDKAQRQWERHQQRQFKKFGNPWDWPPGPTQANPAHPPGQPPSGPPPGSGHGFGPSSGHGFGPGSGPSGFRPPGFGSAGGFAAYTSNMANRLHEYAILGGVRRRIDSQEFEGGDATAVMGGVDLDLTGAGTKLDEIVIEANALMGGVEIRVPQDWEVVVQGVGILGGYDDSTHGPIHPVTPPGVKRPRLIITGQAVFGGVHVRN